MDKRRTLNLGRSTIQGTLSEILQHLMTGRPPSAEGGVRAWIMEKLTAQSRRNFITRNRK